MPPKTNKQQNIWIISLSSVGNILLYFSRCFAVGFSSSAGQDPNAYFQTDLINYYITYVLIKVESNGA